MRRALRWVVVGIALVVLVLSWTSLVTPHAVRSYADYGLRSVSLIGSPLRRDLRIDEIAPRYAHDPAGPHAGDIVDFTRLSYATIADFYTIRSPQLTLAVQRDGRPETVRLTRVWANLPVPAELYAGTLLATVSILVAVVLFLRAPSIMTVALVMYALGTPYFRPVLTQLDALPEWAYVGLTYFSLSLLIEFPSFALLAFVARFPRVADTPLARARVRWADAIVIGAAVICTALALIERYSYEYSMVHQVLAIFATLAVLTFTYLSYRSTAGEERQRVAWVLAALIVTDTAYVLADWVDQMAGSDIISVGIWAFWGVGLQLAGVALPLVLAYVVARHRVVDVGFAFNRAAVFTGTSLLVVGLFAGLQWAVSMYLLRIGASRGYAVQLGIAVAVFFMVRAMRTYTEQTITRVFFARRRRRIDAILGIVEKFADLTDPYAVSPLVVSELRATADLDALFYIQKGAPGTDFEKVSGTLPSPVRIERDDGLAARLRATGRPADVDDGPFEDWLALPLFVRARLRGIMFVKSPTNDTLAPDEVEALRHLSSEMLIAHEDLLADVQRRELQRLTAATAV